MSKTLVQKQFGANAAAYVTSTVHAKGASLERLVTLVAPQPGWQALDVATAAGHTALAFAPHVAHVIASDLTPEMLREAETLAASREVRNISFKAADAEALPFAEATFDLVTCRIAAHHFPDVARFVAEVARVLKPGGRFGLVDNAAPSALTTPGHDGADLAAAADGYNAFEKLRDPSHGRALTSPEWLDLISASGFRIATHEHGWKAMDFTTWCRTMSVPDPMVPRLEAMLDDAHGALRDYLAPTNVEGKRGFRIAELLVVADR